jgi:prolyl 4-hydroxylase
VAVVRNFATDQECKELVKAGGSDQDMGHAIEGAVNERGGAPSSYRRSYLSSIYVDHEDRTNMITRFAERMFAFVRRLTGYKVYGPGQEPINAVLYSDMGDENRPHCDGSCEGQRYVLGERLATSIVYCNVPEINGKPAGGQTSFKRSGLMVTPRKGDLLLFAYKSANNTMDNGFTEHLGFKILGG